MDIDGLVEARDLLTIYEYEIETIAECFECSGYCRIGIDMLVEFGSARGDTPDFYPCGDLLGRQDLQQPAIELPQPEGVDFRPDNCFDQRTQRTGAGWNIDLAEVRRAAALSGHPRFDVHGVGCETRISPLSMDWRAALTVGTA